LWVCANRSSGCRITNNLLGCSQDLDATAAEQQAKLVFRRGAEIDPKWGAFAESA